jgi:quinolinate synthase
VQRNAVVLAHNYMTPDIYHGVADITGDSLALAREAARTDAEVLVVAGVHFMAETAKIQNPDKIVLIPDVEAGCSLASSITPADIRRLRAEHPGAPVVVYVNTTGRGEGRGRRVLHLGQRGEGGGGAERAQGDLPA